MREIAAARAAGREVWLASASDALVVAPLAETVGAAGFFASDGRTNLAGPQKAAALAERFGTGGFDYLGNERRDLAVWRKARRAIGVNLSARLARKLRALDDNARFLDGSGSRPFDLLQALRPHQWIKNLLLFAPLIAAQETRVGAWLLAAALFLALSACASGGYLLNDLLDLPHDRRHQAKRHRPMAAGKLPLLPGIGIGATSMAGGLVLAFWLSTAAGVSVLSYLILTFAYSLFLKRKLLVDVVALSMLYSVRVVAGGVAVSIQLSPWFLGFFLFLFLSLAIVKRQSELHKLRSANASRAGGRGWIVEDLAVLPALSAAGAFASAVVLALYISRPEVTEGYARPEFLWLICPALIYWLGRMTLLANRGIVDEDPVMFAMRDRTSWLTGIGILAAFLAAL